MLVVPSNSMVSKVSGCVLWCAFCAPVEFSRAAPWKGDEDGHVKRHFQKFASPNEEGASKRLIRRQDFGGISSPETSAVTAPPPARIPVRRGEFRGDLVPGLGREGSQVTASSVLLETLGSANDFIQADASPDPSQLHAADLLVYSIRALPTNLYCTDHGKEPIVCDQSVLGIWETFRIFHWSRLPFLHVIQGGRLGKWCRDHGLHVSCNAGSISPSEEFRVVSAGRYKFIRGPERDQWCHVHGKEVLACNATERGLTNSLFLLQAVPHLEEPE
eukprot:TRINITY_DN50419_c0_g1_i1.p1 TRINITY_DN50419_c0_g1~~TRINITY_DN50419_c0_g1_i1.p1  ORF type:complete len:274 (-),score=23.66 TRINITY_DN50419_c0_g1_i1:75-896(-)